MKISPVILLCILLFLVANISVACAQLAVKIERIPDPVGPDHRAYTVIIPMADLKKVSDRWNDYIGKNAYGWESEKHGIHRQRGIMEKSISDTKFAIESELDATAAGVRLSLWPTQNGCPLVNAKTEERMDKAFKKYVQVFANDQYKKAIRIQLKEHQKVKRKLEMKLAALNRAQEDPKHAIAAEDYHGQVASVSIAMVLQNTKTQELLDVLSAIP